MAWKHWGRWGALASALCCAQGPVLALSDAVSSAALARRSYAEGAACRPGAQLQLQDLTTDMEESNGTEAAAVPLVEVRPGLDAGDPDLVYWKILADSPIQRNARLETGAEFMVIRCLPPGRWVHLGKGTVLRASGSLVEGRLDEVATDKKRQAALPALPRSGNLYLQAMAGDLIVPLRPERLAAVEIGAVRRMAWADLFDGDANGGVGLNLSDAGRARLAAEIGHFRNAHGRLLVESFSNRTGKRKQLRASSLERAQIVATYLRRAFGLPQESVVALGLGSDRMQPGETEMPSYPDREIVDGITLRTVPE